MITPARFGDARTRPIYRPEGMHSQAAAVRTLGATPHADDVEDVTHLGGFDAHGLGQLAAQLGNAAVPRDGDRDLDADVPLSPKGVCELAKCRATMRQDPPRAPAWGSWSCPAM